MIRCIFACYLSLFCLCLGTFGQVAKGQQLPAVPPAIDSEYRKFATLTGSTVPVSGTLSATATLAPGASVSVANTPTQTRRDLRV